MYGSVINMSLITLEVKYGAIDADDTSFQVYYIIRVSLFYIKLKKT